MKTRNKMFLLILSLALPALWISCDEDDAILNGNNKYKAEDTFSFEVQVENHSRLRLVAITGSIEIKGNVQANSVLISGTKRVKATSIQDAVQRLNDLDVDVRDMINEVIVVTMQPQDTQGRDYEVDYTITLPDNLEVQVNAVTGNLVVDTISNKVTISHVIGNVNLDEIEGSTYVELVTGSIEGNITLPLDNSIIMRIVTGNIILSVPVNTSAEFSANVITGSINVSNLILLNKVETSTFLAGTLGNGEGTISLRTVTGNINVSGFD
jgi:hypothetical protein